MIVALSLNAKHPGTGCFTESVSLFGGGYQLSKPIIESNNVPVKHLSSYIVVGFQRLRYMWDGPLQWDSPSGKAENEPGTRAGDSESWKRGRGADTDRSIGDGIRAQFLHLLVRMWNCASPPSLLVLVKVNRYE